MENITDKNSLERHLLRCIDRHDQVSFATAWASAGTRVFAALKEGADRINLGVVGIHFSQTDPDFMDAFVGAENVRFVLSPSGVFHPKVLVFGKARQWEAFVGSANLTKGALKRNDEMVVRLTHDDDASGKVRADVLRTIKSYFGRAEMATPETAARYREDWARKRHVVERLAGSYGSTGSKDPLHTRSMGMGWSDYYSALRMEGKERFTNRLAILERARRAFATGTEFNDMVDADRLVIAGLPNEEVAEWGLFGSMFGAGGFRKVFNRRAPQIGAAIDAVPLTGTVGSDEYEAFIDSYRSAFPNGRDGIGSASRLLAMKRPDQFVCLNKRDRNGIAADFGIKSAGSIGYDRYWNEVIARVRDSAWWNAPRPTRGQELAAWNGRVAMMDAIYYENP